MTFHRDLKLRSCTHSAAPSPQHSTALPAALTTHGRGPVLASLLLPLPLRPFYECSPGQQRVGRAK